MAPKDDAQLIEKTHNTARFFTENRHIAWILLLATIGWGLYSYYAMPKRKDPETPIFEAVAICPWPGASADKVEQLIATPIERKIAENARVTKIESTSKNGFAIVHVTLDEKIAQPAREFDDIQLKLDGIRDLPPGAGPVQFLKDFGDTAALMLTVASPHADDVEIRLRAREIERAIRTARQEARSSKEGSRATIAIALPQSANPNVVRRHVDLVAKQAVALGIAQDVRPIQGSGFVGVDVTVKGDDASILRFIAEDSRDRLHVSEFHLDAWQPVVIRQPEETFAKLTAVAGDKYSYRDLDRFTDLMQRTLQSVPQVAKITRSGLLKEQIYLEYSQEKLASYGLQATRLDAILGARNITMPGGLLEIGGKNLRIDPSGEFKSEGDIGNVVIGVSAAGAPAYLRNVVDIDRNYEYPPRYLNFYTWRDEKGQWQRTRAITLALQMRPGQQIAEFGTNVDAALDGIKQYLPTDLVIARTSDQPLQVQENVELFMRSLYEAVVLVVLVALFGFWEWRPALLMAISIPLTLGMTYGMMHMLGIDIQQVSIASLIIALGLLVDDPVVASDAIRRDLEAGHPPLVSAWLGPTKLARAILFATITNIVAYVPLLILSGNLGRFIYSLPVVLACSLVASRIVSMTFIPLLGYYLLRPGRKQAVKIEERRTRGFSGYYYRVGSFAITHRWAVLAGAVLLLGAGLAAATRIKTQFFPMDLSYLSYVDVWLPEDALLSATNEAALAAEKTIVQVAEQYGRDHKDKSGSPKPILRSVTTFTGGGGPRFWFSVVPEIQQLNYAQLVLEVRDKHDTEELIAPLQRALAANVPGARVDVRRLETGKPVGAPLAVRITGENERVLRQQAERLKAVFESVPETDRVRDDWGIQSFAVRLQVNPDQANLSSISNLDVAVSSATSMVGFPVATLREGDIRIPVVARLRMEERAQLSDIQNLYIYSLQGPQKVPLRQVSNITYDTETAKIRRRNQFRTITVSAFPVPGVLSGEVLGKLVPALNNFEKQLPPGFRMEIGGEREEQLKGFAELASVMLISIASIYLALVIQFKHAIKPLVVFATIPFGLVGSFAALAVMGSSFGFMAFLGVASLIGVIVSHVIVLFDFVEERHEHGAPLKEALLDAGILRLRPVLITVGATVFGLVPLALHGGPLWEPLCYTQIGGLTLATLVTLLLVPVLYSIFVLDLRLIKWTSKDGGTVA